MDTPEEGRGKALIQPGDWSTTNEERQRVMHCFRRESWGEI